MPERNTDVLQILIGQMGEYRNVDLIISKALSVLTEVELLKPVRNLLHRCPRPMFSAAGYALERIGPSSQGPPQCMISYSRLLQHLHKCRSFWSHRNATLKKISAVAARCLHEARSTTDPRLKAFLAEKAQEWHRPVEESRGSKSDLTHL